MKVAASVIIERPVEAVWEYIADPANNPEWDPGTIEVRQTSPGPIGVGTTLIAVVDMLGRRELGVRIITFEPKRELQFVFVSGVIAGSKTRYALQSLDGGRTRLTREADAHLNGWWRLLTPLASWLAARSRADEVSNVKRILEVGHHGARA